MKINIYNKVKHISNRISIDFYTSITRQKLILPFYHAVTDDPKPHLKHLNFYRRKSDFKIDLRFFTDHFRSIPIKDIASAKDNCFHLTFDDGLSEVCTEAIPLLTQKNIHATFFINTDFIDNKKLFYRHQLSLIVDAVQNSDDALYKISGFLQCEMADACAKIDKITDAMKIEQMAELLKIDFREYLNDVKPYLTKNQLLEMKKMGFAIGNHSKSHPNFKNILFPEQRQQVTEVNGFLRRELNISDLYFAFPFGDDNIKNEFFEFMYHQEGIISSFGVSGLKSDGHQNHHHRIPMEYNQFSAEEIVKFEYFYYALKSLVNKNKIRR